MLFWIQFNMVHDYLWMPFYPLFTKYIYIYIYIYFFFFSPRALQFSSVAHHVRLFVTPWTAACQASLSISYLLSKSLLLKLWSPHQHHHFLEVVRNVESQTSPQTYWTRICSFKRLSPQVIHMHIKVWEVWFKNIFWKEK